MRDLKCVDLREIPPPRKHTRWGHWHFLQRLNVLQYRAANGGMAMLLSLAVEGVSNVTLDRAAKQIRIRAIVEDADAIRMVKSGTLSMLSLGGTYRMVKILEQPDNQKPAMIAS
jgi:hypothetical protein